MDVFLNDKMNLSGLNWYGNEESFKIIINELKKILNCFNFHVDAKVYYSSINMGVLIENFREINEMTDGLYLDTINDLRNILQEINAVDWTRNKIHREDIHYFHQLGLGAETQSLNDTSLAEACEFQFLKKDVLIVNLSYSEYNRTLPIHINRSNINPPPDMQIFALNAFFSKDLIVNDLIANRKREYRHNIKHGENGRGMISNGRDIVSPLECSIAQATELLKYAVSSRLKNELYVYDTSVDKYMIYKEDTRNKYHGYHPINQNEIPKVVKEFLGF